MDTNSVNLPTELLEMIFSHVEEPNDRRRLSQCCWTFYHIIRRQSSSRSILKLNQANLEQSPIPVFENSPSFPFSKLYIGSTTNFDLNRRFWLKNGPKISEIVIENDGRNMNRFLTRWSTYFPNLRKLCIVPAEHWKSVGLRQVPDLPLPIEELRIETEYYHLHTIRRLQHSTPLLKRLHLAVGNAKMVPALLGWIEKVDEVTVNARRVPLDAVATTIALLPSKVVFTTLFVEANHLTGARIYDEFFEKPRVVDILAVEFQRWKFFLGSHRRFPLEETQILSLYKVESVRHLRILNGPVNCRQRLDLLAGLPGLETIEVKLHHRKMADFGVDHHVYRFWTTPSTAAKIRSIEHHPSMRLSVDGLSGLTSFKFQSDHFLMPQSSIGHIIRQLIQHCPNLKELQLIGVDMNDIDLLSLSSFKQLEALSLINTPHITTQSFDTAFVLPKLKYFEMDSRALDFFFNRGSFDHLDTNFPNLERLILSGATIDNNGLQRLVRRLPYLVEVTICSRLHTVTDEMTKLKLEFPYMIINVSKL